MNSTSSTCTDRGSLHPSLYFMIPKIGWTRIVHAPLFPQFTFILVLLCVDSGHHNGCNRNILLALWFEPGPQNANHLWWPSYAWPTRLILYSRPRLSNMWIVFSVNPAASSLSVYSYWSKLLHISIEILRQKSFFSSIFCFIFTVFHFFRNFSCQPLPYSFVKVSNHL